MYVHDPCVLISWVGIDHPVYHFTFYFNFNFTNMCWVLADVHWLLTRKQSMSMTGFALTRNDCCKNATIKWKDGFSLKTKS